MYLIVLSSVQFAITLNIASITDTCLKDLSRGCYFQDNTPISLIKSYECYFCAGKIFTKQAISLKMGK